MMERIVLGRELMAYMPCECQEKWGSNSDDKIYYDREGLMDVVDLVGYWFFSLIFY